MMPEVLQQYISPIERALGIDQGGAERIASKFDEFVAAPLRKKFSGLGARDVAKRNPFAYASLGAVDVYDWAGRVIDDMLVASTETLIGNWMEEVAIVVSGGIKPAGGADLQLERDGVTHLYAVQMTYNTKNSSGRQGDIARLHESARILRAQRRAVELYVGFCFGRVRTTRRKDGIISLATRDFWNQIAGDPEFAARVLHACTILAPLYSSQAPEHREQILQDVSAAFGDGRGGIDWVRVIDARATRRPRRIARR